MRHFVPSSLLLLIEKALSSHQLLSMFEICWLLSWVSHLHKTSSNHHVISIFIQLILNIHWEMLKDDWLSPFPYIYIKCLSMWLVWNHWALLLCGFLGTGKILENFDILGKEFSFNKSWNNFVTTVLSWNLHNLIIQFIFITQDNLWFKPSPANTVFVCVCVCVSLDRSFMLRTVSWSVGVMFPSSPVWPLNVTQCTSVNSRMEYWAAIPPVSLHPQQYLPSSKQTEYELNCS